MVKGRLGDVQTELFFLLKGQSANLMLLILEKRCGF